MDKLRALTLFCRAVETGSFAAAARSLDTVPSAISKAIAGLEREVGFRLMNRSTRRVVLTDEGAAYHEHARALLLELEEAEARGRAGRAQVRGTVRVGLHPALRHAVLGALGPFLEAHPELTVETMITNSPSALQGDGLDVAVHVGPLADSTLVARPLGALRTVVCAAPAYLSACGDPRHPRELAHHRAVIYARGDEEPNVRWAFARGDERIEMAVPVRVVSRDGIGLVDATLGGCGLARPFAIAVRHWLATGELRTVLSDWEGTPQALCALTPPHVRHVSARVRALVEFIARRLDEEEAQDAWPSTRGSAAPRAA